jgi:oxaloacetate decarboxylase beta subunit
MLMLGNLMRESKVVERLSGRVERTGQRRDAVPRPGHRLDHGRHELHQASTLMILVLGLLAFCLDTVMGVLFGKLMNMFSGGKFNPLIGAAGISAFPMAARVVQKEAQRENFDNFMLMHAMGANAAGQVASVVAGGVLLALMGAPSRFATRDGAHPASGCAPFVSLRQTPDDPR